jgi:hypothetical protein
VQKASAVNMNSSHESRAQQIAAIRAEVKNIATSEDNTNAAINGGQQKPYDSIPVTAPGTPLPSSNGWSYGGVVK